MDPIRRDFLRAAGMASAAAALTPFADTAVAGEPTTPPSPNGR
jgi:hypothetical protein